MDGFKAPPMLRIARQRDATDIRVSAGRPETDVDRIIEHAISRRTEIDSGGLWTFCGGELIRTLGTPANVRDLPPLPDRPLVR